MLSIVGKKLSDWAERYMPDPFIFAIFLTVITFSLAWGFTSHGIVSIAGYWYQGFWGLLAFSMQMCLILLTGYALATTSLVRSMIETLAKIPKNTQSAASLVAFVAIVSGYINWGFAIIVGALMAREVARNAHLNKIPMHYPLLGAAGYMGLAVWHAGFSGSAPLKVATEISQGTDRLIPISETLLAPMNLFVAACIVMGIPILMRWLAPKNEEDIVTIEEIIPDITNPRDTNIQRKSNTLNSKLENSVFVSGVIASCGLFVIVYHFFNKGSIDLNIVNFTFLFLGILLHKTPKNYVDAISEGVKGCSGIILLFPFYAGIQGVMQQCGLSEQIVHLSQQVSTSETYPILTFYSAGLVNVFIPSGGGQWGVQGPIVLKTATEMGVPLGKAVLAFSYGDQWTNLIQPFWALALLGITNLKAHHVMGYCIAVMGIGFVFFTSVLYLF